MISVLIPCIFSVFENLRIRDAVVGLGSDGRR